MGKEYTRSLSTVGVVPAHGGILLYEDFESGWHFRSTQIAFDDFRMITPVAAKSGLCGLLIATDHISPGAGDTALVHIGFPWPETKKVQQDLFYNLQDTGETEFLTFELTFSDGVTTYSAGIRYDAQVGKWQYRNSAGTYTDIPDAGIAIEEKRWHAVEFSVDIASVVYGSLVIGNNNFDLSAYSLATSAAGDPMGAEIDIELSHNATTSVDVWIDDLLMRQV